MKEERIKKLNNELKYLLKEEREKEVINYQQALLDENIKIETIANDIYTKRGIDYKKLNKNLLNELSDNILTLGSIFKNKDSKTRNKMIIELVYIVVLLALIKLPFDLVRDIGYDYISILTTNNAVDIIWHVSFLLLYTITLICTFIILIRNFNKKYKD